MRHIEDDTHPLEHEHPYLEVAMSYIEDDMLYIKAMQCCIGHDVRTREDEIPFIEHEMPYCKAVLFVIKTEGYPVI